MSTQILTALVIGWFSNFLSLTLIWGGGVRHWPWPWHPGIYPMVNGQKNWPWPWHPRFAHGQWSKLTNFGHLTMEILKFWPWSWSKMTNFDHLTTAILKFWPWSWSKIFDHLTMTPGRRPNGQKIMVILPPPPLICTCGTEQKSL